MVDCNNMKSTDSNKPFATITVYLETTAKMLVGFFFGGGGVFCFSKINMLSPYFMAYAKEERLSQSYVYSPRRSDNYCP